MRMRVAPREGGVPADLGRPVLPGSKSHTQRAMVSAAFGAGEWRLEGALRSEDTEVLGGALEELGARVVWGEGGVAVRGRGGGAPRGTVFLAENGTAARVLLTLVPLLGGHLRADGRDGLQRRPMDAVVGVVEAVGGRVRGRRLPMVVDGGEATVPRELVVDGAVTTQVATGAVLAQALRPVAGWRGLLGRPPARCVRVQRPRAGAYLDVTAAVLRGFGYRAAVEGEAGDLVVTVGGRPRRGGVLTIPPDPSARAFPMVLAALHGHDGAAELPAHDDPHPDWAVDGDIARILAPGDEERVIDGLEARPDTFPALAVLAATRRGTTRFVGIPNLRSKESDRIAAMARGLAAAGAGVEELPDGLVVRGPLRGGRDPVTLPTVPDHRIVMALALLGTVLPGGVVLRDTVSVRKSWPTFFDWLPRE